MTSKPSSSAQLRRLSKDAARLITMSQAAADAPSRSENQYWNTHLDTLVTTLLNKAGKRGLAGDKVIFEALEHASLQLSPDVNEVLAASVESMAETCLFDIDGGASAYQATLFSIPMIAWSKYQIPAGELSDAVTEKIHQDLAHHIIHQDVSFSVSPFLYSIDQLPQSFVDTRQLIKEMADATVNEDPIDVRAAKRVETFDVPADARFVLGAAVSKHGTPVFRWQDLQVKDVSQERAEAFEKWLVPARAVFLGVLTGCEFELGLPNLFFHNCRQADIRVRPHSLRAVLGGMQEMLAIPAAEMSVVVANVGTDEVDEYRISIGLKGRLDVLNGMVWPLYDQEDAETRPSPREVIEHIFKDQKIGDVVLIDEILPPEFCEDCGAPLFYNRDAEAVHAQMPDDIDHSAAQYH